MNQSNPSSNIAFAFVAVIVTGLIVLGGLTYLLISKTSSQIASKTQKQLHDVGVYQNPFVSPTPTYQNPFAQTSSQSDQYQNPFAQ